MVGLLSVNSMFRFPSNYRSSGYVIGMFGLPIVGIPCIGVMFGIPVGAGISGYYNYILGWRRYRYTGVVTKNCNSYWYLRLCHQRRDNVMTTSQRYVCREGIYLSTATSSATLAGRTLAICQKTKTLLCLTHGT